MDIARRLSAGIVLLLMSSPVGIDVVSPGKLITGGRIDPPSDWIYYGYYK